jgi:hypothetical protein
MVLKILAITFGVFVVYYSLKHFYHGTNYIIAKFQYSGDRQFCCYYLPILKFAFIVIELSRTEQPDRFLMHDIAGNYLGDYIGSFDDQKKLVQFAQEKVASIYEKYPHKKFPVKKMRIVLRIEHADSV